MEMVRQLLYYFVHLFSSHLPIFIGLGIPVLCIIIIGLKWHLGYYYSDVCLGDISQLYPYNLTEIADGHLYLITDLTGAETD